MVYSHYFLYRNIMYFYFIEVFSVKNINIVLSTKDTCTSSIGYRTQGRNGTVAAVLLCYVIKMSEN